MLMLLNIKSRIYIFKIYLKNNNNTKIYKNILIIIFKN